MKLSDLAITGNKKNQNKWLAPMFKYSPIYSGNRQINFISLLPELPLTFTRFQVNLLAPVVQKVDSAFHQINLYPVDSVIGFPNAYPLDRDLSG